MELIHSVVQMNLTAAQDFCQANNASLPIVYTENDAMELRIRSNLFDSNVLASSSFDHYIVYMDSTWIKKSHYF